MPSATSRAIDPVGMTSIGALTSSPRRMTAPLPCARSMLLNAADKALSRSMPAIANPPGRDAVVEPNCRGRHYEPPQTVFVPDECLWTAVRCPQSYEQVFEVKPTRRTISIPLQCRV